MNKLPIGILSGTFDPIHLGHLHLATTIHKRYNLPKILLIPCRQSPFKKPPIANTKDRIKMLQLAIENLSYLEIENHETQKPTISYTIDTLKYLSQKHLSSPLIFIMGIDVFNEFTKWREWKKILDLAHLLVVNRKSFQLTSEEAKKLLIARKASNFEQLSIKKSGLIYMTTIDPLPITATTIRTLIKQKKDANHLVNNQVWRYINNNKLYPKNGSCEQT